MDYHTLFSQLVPLYGTHESQSIARLVFCDVFNLGIDDIIMGKDQTLAETDAARLTAIADRLLSGEPVQYVLGETTFDGLRFTVNRHTLIPRPETEQLVQLISNFVVSPRSILDIGTGTGCIAISLKKRYAKSRVVAVDKSDDALKVAKENAQKNNADVEFYMADALNMPQDNGEFYSIVVSNPPYICQKEAAEMHKNVLDYEPHEALFVPDDDPLLFYRAISSYAINHLEAKGELWFELNPIYSLDVQAQLQADGYENIQLIDDFNEKKRFVRATR